jgi:DNA-binding NtrC family response regulator
LLVSVRAVRTSWLETTGFEVLASSDLDQALGRVPQFTPDVLLIDSGAYPMELGLLAETIVTPVVVPMPVVTTAWRTALYEKCGDAMVFGLPCPPGAVLAALDRALAGGNHGPRGGNGPVHVGRKARTGESPSMHRHRRAPARLTAHSMLRPRLVGTAGGIASASVQNG